MGSVDILTDMADVIITGLPRSGTTLTCELLNDAKDTVALDEPIDQRPWTKHDRTAIRRLLPARLRQRMPSRAIDPAGFVADIAEYFHTTRASLLGSRQAVSKNVGGKVTGRKFLDERSESGLRDQVTTRQMITIDKELSPDFVLAVKHNAGFTVMLEHLAKRFPSFAIVRNPLATIASWQTVPIPIQKGRSVLAEVVDPELRARLDATPDVLDRQFVLLEWFFGSYKAVLPPEHVLRYEDIVATGGRALAPISPGAAELDSPLQSRNRTKVYDEDSIRRIGDRLLASDGPWWDYYTRDSVRELVDA